MDGQLEYDERFIIVRDVVMRKFPGKHMAKALIYSIVESYVNSGLDCYMTDEQIGQRIGINRNNVGRHISWLRKNGYIKSKRYLDPQSGTTPRKMWIGKKIKPIKF